MSVHPLLREIPGLLLKAAKGWSSDNVPRLGASLAYYTLFSIGPILLIAIAIAGFVFGPEAVRGEIVQQLQGMVGPDGAKVVQDLVESASLPGRGAIAITVGAVTFLLAATGVFLELQHALNTIFRVKAKSDSGISGMVKARIRSFGLVLSIGFVLMVSLGVSAALAAMSAYLGDGAGVSSIIWQVINVAVSFGVITLMFALIYRFLPDVKLSWRDVWVGSITTALLFTIGKQLLAVYLGHSSTASSYGAAGSVIVLLLWVYYSAQIILFGAELTRIYAERCHGPPEAVDFAEADANARPSEAGKPLPASSKARTMRTTVVNRSGP